VRAERLTLRGFRNLADLDRELPPAGAALLGHNGQGKTNLLEALYYPVLCRSFRGALDGDVTCFGGLGFHVSVAVRDGDVVRELSTGYQAGTRRKRIAVDGGDVERVQDVVGTWVAVAFLPSDTALASGPAVERRQYLDRMLALADREYLTALGRYRAALAQRNSALRQHRPELARAFDRPLAEAGARVTRGRLAWSTTAAERFGAALADLEETGAATLTYQGRSELAEPEAWTDALERARGADEARRTTTVGPHRDDVVLSIGGRPLRLFGSTGQQRSAAVALKLVEIATLEDGRGSEPALLLDDVFAELDRTRQRRLAERLMGRGRQVFVTAPRRDELPDGIALPVWTVEGGVVKA
jgi:DNA replication and repair protein RecF